MLLQFLSWKSNSNNQAQLCFAAYVLLVLCLGLLLDPEVGAIKSIRNVGKYLREYAASYWRRLYVSIPKIFRDSCWIIIRKLYGTLSVFWGISDIYGVFQKLGSFLLSFVAGELIVLSLWSIGKGLPVKKQFLIPPTEISLPSLLAALFPRVKRPGRESNRSSQSRA
jgi:hypothetical protein